MSAEMKNATIRLTTKPNRRQLLKVVSELQSLIGHAKALHANDRDPNGFENAQDLLEAALNLCHQARSFDPPT